MDIKDRLRKIKILRNCIRQFRILVKTIKQKDFFNRMAKVSDKGYGTFKKVIDGKGNNRIIGNSTFLNSTVFHIIGNYNTIKIGSNCSIGKDCSFWIEGNNISIEIGDYTSFTHTCHFCAQENNTNIKVGEDCMFSNNIIVRTSDSHSIINLNTNDRINHARNVVIGKHVWIAPQSIIMKGAIIGDGTIVGSRTLVTKTVPENCLAVGAPAKVVKTNVSWSREDIIFK